MKNVAVYSGSFDPITFGHIDLVRRAQKLFDRIIIAIAKDNSKSSLFSLEERFHLVKQVFKEDPQIEIESFSGLLVEFVKRKEANVILRGLRVISDFDYEFRMANINRVLETGFETVFLVPSERYTYVSSSIVREVAFLKGDVSQFVPPEVVSALKSKFT